jgi:hypothetical protein
VVNAALVPVRLEPSVAVTVWTTGGAAALVVNVTVAMPEPSVVLVGEENVPPLVLLQVTTMPDVATGLSFASASCAVTVTSVPATGLELLTETRYFVGVPAVMSIAFDVAPVSPVALKLKVRAPTVPVIIKFVNVATPLALLVAVSAPPNVPPPVAIAAVTTTPL